MKVIGMGYDRDSYICEISHRELEKFLNQYYGKRKRLEVGDDLDLGTGYDFLKEIERVFSEFKRFCETNKKDIMEFISWIGLDRKEIKQEIIVNFPSLEKIQELKNAEEGS